MTAPDPLAQLPATTADGQARASVLAQRNPVDSAPNSFVTYVSSGRLLVIGPLEAAVTAARRLRDELEVRVLATDGAGPRLSRPDVEDFGGRLLRARIAAVEGHLGAFRVSVADGEAAVDVGLHFGFGPDETFDLVLDLGDPPALQRQKLPPGYFLAVDDAALTRALSMLPELVGEFDKPRYFEYDPEICAHGSRGQTGCTRCLDVCATEAIRSRGERIEVDPFLCQGCGSCATACPTGAITYTAPSGETLVDELRRLLRQYREAGGRNPVILLHDGEAGAAALAGWAAAMPESILPLEVEDTGGIGPDAWLAALAFGAGRVLLALPAETPPSERAATVAEIEVVRGILAGLGMDAARVAVLDIGGDESVLAEAPEPLVTEYATFAGMGGKRERMRRAIEHLYRQAGEGAGVQPLPASALYGTIEVDVDACTLCMACVSVCPTQAVRGGGEVPRLDFLEDRCVQCGICEHACPEDAIRLVPRIDYAAHVEEPEARVLNETEMHYCPGCGKPFAAKKVIERMEQRLSGHWMFADNQAARERLWLCEDCRVKAMMHDEGLIDPHR